MVAITLGGPVALAGCGSSSSSSAAATTAGSTVSSASSASASTAKTSGSAMGNVSGKVDCVAVKDALSHLVVNWQLIVQLPKETDVSKWKDVTTALGTFDQFGVQLDTLQTQLGSNAEAAKAIVDMRGAYAIAQKGRSGDSTAPAALGRALGADLVAALGTKTPLITASSAAGC